MAIVHGIGWVLYSVLLTDSVEDLDRPRYAQVYFHFKDLPFHSLKMSQESLDDEAISWMCGGTSVNGIDC